MATITDDFNRANGGLGANYTRALGLELTMLISSNVVQLGSTSQESYELYTGSSFGDDQEASYTAVSGLGSASRYAELVARGSGVDGTFQGYAVFTNGLSGAGNCGIGRYNGGVFTELKVVSDTFADGDTLGIRVTGSTTVTIVMLKNGSPIDSITDSSGSRVASGGTIGVGGYNGSGAYSFDNFTGGDYSAAVGGGSSKNLMLLGVG